MAKKRTRRRATAPSAQRAPSAVERCARGVSARAWASAWSAPVGSTPWTGCGALRARSVGSRASMGGSSRSPAGITARPAKNGIAQLGRGRSSCAASRRSSAPAGGGSPWAPATLPRASTPSAAPAPSAQWRGPAAPACGECGREIATVWPGEMRYEGALVRASAGSHAMVLPRVRASASGASR